MKKAGTFSGFLKGAILRGADILGFFSINPEEDNGLLHERRELFCQPCII
jgi:hypothetical protein